MLDCLYNLANLQLKVIERWFLKKLSYPLVFLQSKIDWIPKDFQIKTPLKFNQNNKQSFLILLLQSKAFNLMNSMEVVL